MASDYIDDGWDQYEDDDDDEEPKAASVKPSSENKPQTAQQEETKQEGETDLQLGIKDAGKDTAHVAMQQAVDAQLSKVDLSKHDSGQGIGPLKQDLISKDLMGKDKGDKDMVDKELDGKLKDIQNGLDFDEEEIEYEDDFGLEDDSQDEEPKVMEP